MNPPVQSLLRSRWSVTALCISWVAAIVLCAIDPFLSHCHTDTGGHAAQPQQHEHTDSAPTKGQHENTFCQLLEIVCKSEPKVSVPAPKLVFFAFLIQSGSEIAQTTDAGRFSRQRKTRDWVFTPKVCLGPAFRSVGPPAS